MAEKKILIVDDNQMNLELVSDILGINGYQVLQAGDAKTGIDIAKKEIPDLILMDVQLPGMDGLQATSILKEDAATRDIPVVALTAHAMNGAEENVLKTGCAGYISKPIDTRGFPGKVEGFLKR
jgi:CheY-like chemotaxis protein